VVTGALHFFFVCWRERVGKEHVSAYLFFFFASVRECGKKEEEENGK
jgi:hypothetical protein